ncbi:MurR/RpiR family transcriptional regulator [Erysipelothrix sp. HDW6C]|uniref:MurR/RpiR family transcriptional regulator n=1 Tax=Erysipelothrix sp. HDW6C TaxID=2714930 RepID=UPI00140BF842|nr:MurR/RpiR family transcriptional regulator [Erysipelothrix sp. HDW6C]QIK68835.1 MurR/RpiR family transcriptional regulator [Erysipelothrix sp. HDW6C]
MLLINRLKNETNVSSAEAKVVDFILQDPKRIINITIHELAELTFSSASTITRFCRKMQTDGFSDFKLQLARELSASNVSGERIEDNLPFAPNQTSQEIINRILNLNFQSMNDTYNQIDLPQIERIARQIYEAPSLYLYGTGQSLILAQDFQYKLLNLGISCDLESQVGFQIMKAGAQPKDSLALIVSYYGQGQENKRIKQVLTGLGIPYILFTGPNENPLCEGAHEVVHVPPQEELILKMASFSSRTAIQLVLDFVYALIFSFDYENNRGINNIKSRLVNTK